MLVARAVRHVLQLRGNWYWGLAVPWIVLQALEWQRSEPPINCAFPRDPVETFGRVPWWIEVGNRLDLVIVDVECRHLDGVGYAANPNGKLPYVVIRLDCCVADARSLCFEPDLSRI